MENPRLGAVCGALAVVANIVAVAVLSTGVGSAYRIDELGLWISQAQASPTTSDLAALLFMLGCAAFLPLGFALGRTQGSVWGGRAIAFAGTLNVAGPVFTIVATRTILPGCDGGPCREEVAALFRRAIEFDAAFNLALGVGLILLGARTLKAKMHRLLGLVSIAVGALTLPVALQFSSGAAARWLAVAGPLWLCVLIAWSIVLWRTKR